MANYSPCCIAIFGEIDWYTEFKDLRRVSALEIYRELILRDSSALIVQSRSPADVARNQS